MLFLAVQPMQLLSAKLPSLIQTSSRASAKARHSTQPILLLFMARARSVIPTIHLSEASLAIAVHSVSPPNDYL
jgi:hypothetical protein